MNNTSGNSLSSHSELTFPDWNKNCARGSQNLLEILNDEEY